MTFLAPAAALTAAAIGLPLLLILYLLKLRRRPVRVGSILFWPVAKEDAQANVPLRWLHPSLLLFLHLLIFAAFAAALARPVLTKGSPPSSRIVLLLDTSASMSAIDDNQTLSRLDLAKKKALDLVDTLRSSSGRNQVCLVTFAAEARAVTGFTTSRSVIEDSLTTVTPTDQPGLLAPALKLIDAISVSEDEEAEPPTAILLSDGSFRDQGKLPASTTHLRFERIGSTGVPPVTPQSAAPDNLGIVNLSARRDAADPAVVRVFVDLLNTNPTQITAPLSLSINASIIEHRTLDIPPATPASPGRTATTFELKNSDGGILIASISREDALAADNTAALILPPAQRPSILLVQPDASSDKDRSLSAASWILEDALAELRSRSFSSISISEYERRAAADQLTADLVVFDRVAPQKLPPVPTISFGAIPPATGISAGPERGSTTVLFWNRPHPIMRNVALDSVQIAQTTDIQIDPSIASSTTELMRGSSGPLLILLQEGAADSGGTRRLIAGFDLSLSNWPLQAGFPIFLADAVDFLTLRADAAAGRSFKTDEPVEVRTKPDSTGRVSLKGPTPALNLTLRQPNATPSGVLTAGILPKAGVYLVEGDSALDHAIAVNLTDETESALASPATLEVAGKPVEGVTTAAAPREVWDWFVMAALGLLVVEWFVYARSVRA